jgi:hypothetical protein
MRRKKLVRTDCLKKPYAITTANSSWQNPLASTSKL